MVRCAGQGSEGVSHALPPGVFPGTWRAGKIRVQTLLAKAASSLDILLRESVISM
ncbi:MAG: hypothetical protein A4E61_00474 [Syntrophorhabdus sp. PtaB.Bin184]|nr:MAG: hypothetical protein A4E61_00474 [Syntrophorhabdus sp. PtaB.Bin184]